MKRYFSLQLTIAIAFCAAAGLRTYGAAQAPVDSSVQSSPVKAPASAPAVDASVESSPVTGGPATKVPAHIAAGTPLALRLLQSCNSATLKNGDTLAAVLSAPVKLSGGGSLPSGTKVGLSVETTVPAGKMESAGEFTLQVVRVGTIAVETETQDFKGKPGHKDLPDSAPAKGTEATLAAGSTLTFHVRPKPTM